MTSEHRWTVLGIMLAFVWLVGSTWLVWHVHWIGV